MWLLAKDHERCGRISLALQDYSKCKELLLENSLSLIYGEVLNENAIFSKMKNLNAQEYLLQVENLYKNCQYDAVVKRLNPIFSPESNENEIIEISKTLIYGEDHFQRRVGFHRMFFEVIFYHINFSL